MVAVQPNPGEQPVPAGAKRDAEATRERILAAARPLFAERGYEETTVRLVAARAGTAPNLITRYFGGKEGLFLAAAQSDLDTPSALPGPLAALGHRIAAAVVSRWEGSPDRHDPMLILMRAATGRPEAARALDTFFRVQAFEPMHEHFVNAGRTPGEATDLATAISSIILGVITARYVMRMGPLVATPYDELQAWLGRCLQDVVDATPTSHLASG